MVAEVTVVAEVILTMEVVEEDTHEEGVVARGGVVVRTREMYIIIIDLLLPWLQP